MALTCEYHSCADAEAAGARQPFATLPYWLLWVLVRCAVLLSIVCHTLFCGTYTYSMTLRFKLGGRPVLKLGGRPVLSVLVSPLKRFHPNESDAIGLTQRCPFLWHVVCVSQQACRFSTLRRVCTRLRSQQACPRP